MCTTTYKDTIGPFCSRVNTSVKHIINYGPFYFCVTAFPVSQHAQHQGLDFLNGTGPLIIN